MIDNRKRNRKPRQEITLGAASQSSALQFVALIFFIFEVSVVHAYHADSRNVGANPVFLSPDGSPAPTDYVLWFVADTNRDGVPTAIESGQILGADDVLIFQDTVDGSLLGEHPGKHQRLNIPVTETYVNANIYVYLWAVSANQPVGEEGQRLGIRNLGLRPPPTLGNADWSMTQPLTANQFQVQPLDADDDELPDNWETAHFGDTASATPTGDPDGDGQNNRAEFRAGTIPTDATSVLRILSLQSIGDEWRIGFSSVSGKVYTVECCDDLLLGNWQSLSNGITGNGASLEILDPTADAVPQRFYRLRLVEP